MEKKKGTDCSDQCGCGDEIPRRDFVKFVGLGSAILPEAALARRRISSTASPAPEEDPDWPVLRSYDASHLTRIALPLGGIGTGTVSLGARGDLRDWELMNRPAKGFVPASQEVGPHFLLCCRKPSGASVTRLLEGPLDPPLFEGSHGSRAPNENVPRFRECRFDTAYPFGRVHLSDSDVPLTVELRGFNPLVPGDAEASGLPVAVISFVLHNRTRETVHASLCGTLPNFIGIDGWDTERDWKGDRYPRGAAGNQNEYREESGLRGLFLSSQGVHPQDEAWGTISLATPNPGSLTYRRHWKEGRWGAGWLDFWDDFSLDGRLDPREGESSGSPIGSLALEAEIAPGQKRKVTFLLTWHFPNRYTWTRRQEGRGGDDLIGNYYTTRYRDAWDVARQLPDQLEELYEKTRQFTLAVCSSNLPLQVRESALFNLSTLRTQTCFRTADGTFFGWEGLADNKGCCHGSCTHVWNYEQATGFLFGDLARSMRTVEFLHATNDEGLMSFRVNLPLTRAQEFGKAAADGQMGCIMKMYRDWQLSGDEEFLRSLWPRVRKALEFCWIEGGWDADRDGVMEGCQHNTMDVEYYGPNPQMGLWYLGALRAAEEMADYLGEREFARQCRSMFESGSRWIDENLFNGQYYEHRIRPLDKSRIAPSLLIGMGAEDPSNPSFQLGSGCLVDQLVGQFMAHVCHLGYLVAPDHVRQTLRSIWRFNHRDSLEGHFNSMRTFALDGESALLMADYPEERPKQPFPYFTEVMTGFEYTAAVGMLYEGLEETGLEAIRDIRARYDGSRRNPYNEAECGHHYARAMASWAAILALTGFRYSAVERSLSFDTIRGRHFWSTGYAWGTVEVGEEEGRLNVDLSVLSGDLEIAHFTVDGVVLLADEPHTLSSGDHLAVGSDESD